MAVAGLFGATKGQVGLGADGWGVNINDAGVDIPHGLKGLIDVASVNRSRKPVDHVVGDFESVLEIVARNHTDHGAEDFLLRDAHLRVAVGEDGGFVEPAARIGAAFQPVTAGDELGSFVDADLDVFHHGLKLRLVDAGSHFGGGVETVADLQRFGAGGEALDKLFVNLLVHGDAAGRSATLPGGPKAAPDGAIDGEVEVRVIHHDNDVFPPHLELAVLEAGGTGFADTAAHLGGPSEAHQRHVRVAHQWRPHFPAPAGQNIHNPARHSRLGEDLNQVVSGKRRVRGGLEHHGVAANQRRHNLPRGDGHRKIPRRNHRANANGLPDAHGKFIAEFRRCGLAELPAALAGHVVGHVDCFLDVAASFDQDFAHLAGHVPGEVFLALQQHFGGAKQDFRALGSGYEPPPVVGLLGGIDRRIDVLFGRGGEHSNQLVGVGGVAIFKRLVAAGLHPLAVDVVFENLGNDSRGHRSSSTLRNAFDCERRARGFYNASRREQTSSVAGGVRSVKRFIPARASKELAS